MRRFPAFPRFLRPLTLTAFVGVAACSVLVGCEEPGAKTALGYTADAKRAYDAAMEEFTAHNWIEAVAKMREVKRKYSYSKYARLAELRIADADYEQEKFADAIREYRQFVHDHRSDNEEVAYARSRIAQSEYAQITDSVLLAAGEERDQAIVYDAYKEIRGFLHDYPESRESPHMRELLAIVTARLIRHELYVARFYLQRENYDAAVLRIQYALRNFTTSDGVMPAGESLEPEALLLLGETYLKMHKWSDARGAFQTITKRFVDSGLILPARGYLQWMQERGV